MDNIINTLSALNIKDNDADIEDINTYFKGDILTNPKTPTNQSTNKLIKISPKTLKTSPPKTPKTSPKTIRKKTKRKLDIDTLVTTSTVIKKYKINSLPKELTRITKNDEIWITLKEYPNYEFSNTGKIKDMVNDIYINFESKDNNMALKYHTERIHTINISRILLCYFEVIDKEQWLDSDIIGYSNYVISNIGNICRKNSIVILVGKNNTSVSLLNDKGKRKEEKRNKLIKLLF